MSLFFAFLAFFGWGVGDIFGTIATRKIGPLSTAIWFSLFQFLIFIVFSLFFLGELQQITLPILALNLVLGLVSVLATVTFYTAMGSANASLAGTIVSSFAALTVILSIVFLGESLTSQQALAIVVIFIGIAISSLNFKELRQGKLTNSRGIAFALASMVFWGIYFAFLKIPVSVIGWYWPVVFSQITYLALFFFMMLRKIKIVNPNSKGALTALILNAVNLGVGTFSYNIAIERGLVAVVAPIAGAYCVLFAILAYFVFHDPLTKREGLGIVTTLFGIVLLSFLSV